MKMRKYRLEADVLAEKLGSHGGSFTDADGAVQTAPAGYYRVTDDPPRRIGSAVVQWFESPEDFEEAYSSTEEPSVEEDESGAREVDYSGFLKRELVQACEERGLDPTGTKDDLIATLKSDDGDYLQGVESSDAS